MKKKINFYNIIIAVLAAIILFSLFMIIRTIMIGKIEQSAFDDISKQVMVQPTEENDEKEKQPERDISPVLAQNFDAIGWIYLPGTVINYPVMHTPNDPEKYLHLNFYQKRSNSGTPFMDYRCTEDSTNIFIYGHNMKNGTMFHQLKRYRSLSYLQENPIIEFQTASGIKKFNIFAVASLSGDDNWFSFVNAGTPEAYQSKIDYIKANSLYDSGITPEYPTKLITLSTCTNGGEGGRLIVVAVQME